jgi:methylenetetrahydrofolate reductase (NADPH)
MRITDILHSGAPSLSFEVFPPKSDAGYDSIREATERIAALKPSFMSVTCRGGGSEKYTVDIAANLSRRFGIPVLAHLTCVDSTKSGVAEQLESLREAGIENVLALRGDVMEDSMPKEAWSCRYASELAAAAKDYGGFCVGGACYPEGHIESATLREDVENLKKKVDAGCEFLTTQMFFDNNILYNFLYKAREAGITVPVVAGIMPVTNAKQIRRITGISGTVLPRRFLHIVDRFGDKPDAMLQAGVAYATEQIIDLYANGIRAVHVYSMNHPQVAEAIGANLSAILA